VLNIVETLQPGLQDLPQTPFEKLRTLLDHPSWWGPHPLMPLGFNYQPFITIQCFGDWTAYRKAPLHRMDIAVCQHVTTERQTDWKRCRAMTIVNNSCTYGKQVTRQKYMKTLTHSANTLDISGRIHWHYGEQEHMPAK